MSTRRESSRTAYPFVNDQDNAELTGFLNKNDPDYCRKLWLATNFLVEENISYELWVESGGCERESTMKLPRVRDIGSGIVDARVSVPGAAGVEMTSVTVSSSEKTLNFKSGETARTFRVPRAARGLVRVTSDESDTSFLTVLAQDLATRSVTVPEGLKLRLEPCLVTRETAALSAVNLVSAKMSHSSLVTVTGSRFSLALGPGKALNFEDGYNCSVSYDSDSGTLTFKAGVGLGKGTAPVTPWDSGAPDLSKGIKSINGVRGGSASLGTGQSIEMTSVARSNRKYVTFTARKDWSD